MSSSVGSWMSARSAPPPPAPLALRPRRAARAAIIDSSSEGESDCLLGGGAQATRAASDSDSAATRCVGEGSVDEVSEEEEEEEEGAARGEHCARMARSLFEASARLREVLGHVLATGVVPKAIAGHSAARRDVVVHTQPRSLSEGHTLKPHQLIGLSWLLSCWSARANCILADDMGLGKTVQVCGGVGGVGWGPRTAAAHWLRQGPSSPLPAALHTPPAHLPSTSPSPPPPSKYTGDCLPRAAA